MTDLILNRVATRGLLKTLLAFANDNHQDTPKEMETIKFFPCINAVLNLMHKCHHP